MVVNLACLSPRLLALVYLALLVPLWQVGKDPMLRKTCTFKGAIWKMLYKKAITSRIRLLSSSFTTSTNLMKKLKDLAL